MSFCERLKSARLAKGYTQEQLARMIGIAKSTLTGYEKGNREPDVLKIKKLATALDISGDYLICNDRFIKTEPSTTLTNQEQSHIDKLRSLDAHGKETVGVVLEKEHERIEKLKQEHLANEQGERENKEREKKRAAERDLLSGEDENYEEEFVDMTLVEEKAAAGIGTYLYEESAHNQKKFRASDVPNAADFAIRIEGDSMEPTIIDGSIVWVELVLGLDDGELGIFVYQDRGYCKRFRTNPQRTRATLESDNDEYEDIRISDFEQLRIYGRVITRYGKVIYAKPVDEDEYI